MSEPVGTKIRRLMRTLGATLLHNGIRQEHKLRIRAAREAARRATRFQDRSTACRHVLARVARIATGTASLVLPTIAARTASASESLSLIPDYAFFGLLSDESGLGTLWVMLAGFTVLIIPLNALIFQPIFRALDARAERIQGARQRSEHLQREADSILQRYETAVRETRGEAEAARQVEILRAREEQVELTSQAKQEAERQLESARTDLAASLESARAGLRASAEDLARAAAEQVLGRALS
jgi:F-type H+-transporting ATPase subunit b